MSRLQKHFAKAIATVLLGLAASPAFATYSCSGPVSGVTVGPTGVVSAASAGGQQWTYFCRLGVTENGVSPEACKGVLTVLLTAQTTGKNVQLWFDDGLTCSTHPTWAWLSVWYWGPQLVD